ncbi:MAG TPA: ribonuclease P protein component [Gammaproteobacteria bacterium]|nr:ribonuclease P protein component [Gammaproteobacteria bacterium]
MSFPRSHRLITKAEYQYVFDQSRKINQKHLLVLFKPNQQLHARLGLIVGKRIAKNAVARNRIKRAIRESFRFHQERLKGIDLIVIARHECDKLNNEKLRVGINQLWQKLLIQYQPALLS